MKHELYVTYDHGAIKHMCTCDYQAASISVQLLGSRWEEHDQEARAEWGDHRTKQPTPAELIYIAENGITYDLAFGGHTDFSDMDDRTRTIAEALIDLAKARIQTGKELTR